MFGHRSQKASPTSTLQNPTPDAVYSVGIDVGSTTVKTVVREKGKTDLLCHLYVRHESRQAETVLEGLRHVEHEFGVCAGNTRLFMTGSGGQMLAQMLGARFIQEVTAVSSAVERFYPDAGSVIEIGGQDSKVILFRDTNVAGRKKKIATMNDKCAGGTGAVIERISAKLNISPAQLALQQYDGIDLHAVAGKCGVFAETDITGLQKQGIPASQLMASLFDAIVVQNLTVLARGNMLLPKVLLLGGPNAFLPGMQQAWRHNLLRLWQQHEVAVPDGIPPEELIIIPEMAELFGAIGAIEFGVNDEDETGHFRGTEDLEKFLKDVGTSDKKNSAPGLCSGQAELEHFAARYSVPKVPSPALRAGETVPVYLGLDGGSTSTKAVFLSESGKVLESAYRLSRTDPITDGLAVVSELRDSMLARGLKVELLGAATTGYSKDLLRKVLHADVALVETVAHAKSALHFHSGVDTIVDVGGQDIKILVLRDGTVQDFRLNTQCSAGNGYFLQATAESLGIRIEDYADVAFRSRQMPLFSYGCAIFLQADIVDYQRHGWKPEEILAGLAAVLPKNVFLYVAGISNLASLGRRYVLQGGTQRNLAVVKAELDFIQSHYHGDGEPEVLIHPHCGEAGAIGAALEAMELHKSGHKTQFIGLDRLQDIVYSTVRDESTRCPFCSNHCPRTFIDVTHGTPLNFDPDSAQRIILATCERGESTSVSEAKNLNRALAATRAANPNIVQIAADQAWISPKLDAITEAANNSDSGIFEARHRKRARKLRENIHIGIPRALNLYSYAPLFLGYFQSLGIPYGNVLFSGTTTQAMFKRAVGFAAVDPCFPSKICIAHVFDLLEKSRGGRHLDLIFFPMLDTLTTFLADGCSGSNACPAGAATPEAVKAAFSRNRNWFEEAGVQYVNPVLNLADVPLLRYQMHECFKELLDLSWEENSAAIDAGFKALASFEKNLRQQSRQVLDELERTGRVGIVMLGRPYHHDPGLNHGIIELLQELGYPIFSQSFLPLDADLLERVFAEDLKAKTMTSPFDINDVWKNSFSASTNHKIWAAKFVARHPNLVPVELSSFKCGHDAFISRVIEQIAERAGKPHFCFRDLDENRPLASIRIRVETIHYFVEQYRRNLQ